MCYKLLLLDWEFVVIEQFLKDKEITKNKLIFSVQTLLDH